MKKHFIAVIMITISTVCLFTVSSCSKDDECTCTESGMGSSSSRQLDPKSYGATNCSDLEVKLRMQAGYDSDFDYSCH